MKITLGLTWFNDGHRLKVTKLFKNGKAQITETWCSEDTWKDMKKVSNYGIAENENGEQYVYSIKYPEYKLYACGAVNA